jgi:hypothetical protein
VVVFQPHRYSRTRDLLPAFGTALGAADEVILTDIYAAGEDPIAGATAEAVEAAVRKSGGAVRLVKALDEIPAAVAATARPNDLVITLGAGSIGSMRDRMLEALSGPAGVGDERQGPGGKNFRRARVRPGVKKGARSRLAGGCRGGPAGGRRRHRRAYSAYRGTDLVLHASALQVRRISVHGNVRISSGEVQSIVHGLRGSNILTADLPGYRRRLMQSPWVADVAMRRVLPSTVEVFVSERRPIGLCRLGNTLYLIDPAGTLIDEFGPQYAEFDLPIIDGLVAAPYGPADHRRGARRARGARDRRALGPQGPRAAPLADRRPRRARRGRAAAGRRCAASPPGKRSSSSACSRAWISRRRCASACGHRLRGPAVRRTRLRAPGVDKRWAVFGPLGMWGGLQTRRRGEQVARKEHGLVGLDVGTSKIAAIVGEITEDDGLDIIGLGLAESKGIRRGVVVNLEAAVESSKKAVDEAELTAGVEIDSVHLGLSGAHVKAFNSRGVVAVAGKNREITREDVRRAIDAAKAVALPSGREILHVLPQDFVVDSSAASARRSATHAPRVNVHVVTGSASSTQNASMRTDPASRCSTRSSRAARRQRGGADRRREAARRGDRRHRRRNHGLRDLRAREHLAHGGGRGRR